MFGPSLDGILPLRTDNFEIQSTERPAIYHIVRLNPSDVYSILRVPKADDAETLKRVYHKLVLQWHPDNNPDNLEEAQTKFQLIFEAYSVLSHINKRAPNDRYGQAGQSSAASARPRRDVFGRFSVTHLVLSLVAASMTIHFSAVSNSAVRIEADVANQR
jgi:DnaJ-class molecular chaperone